MPGPVDPARMLVAELVEGALAGVSGVVRPDWDAGKFKGSRFSDEVIGMTGKIMNERR